MIFEVSADDLQRIFDIAEARTSKHFDGRTCTLETKRGTNECPICYFRLLVKKALKDEFIAPLQISNN